MTRLIHDQYFDPLIHLELRRLQVVRDGTGQPYVQSYEPLDVLDRKATVFGHREVRGHIEEVGSQRDAKHEANNEEKFSERQNPGYVCNQVSWLQTRMP